MKKLMLVSALYIFCSCGNSDNNESSSPNTDETGLTNPSAIDTIKHPSGIDNSSVISTDTAAMNVQNSLRKADSARADSAKRKQ
jgi:hypothetical protein